MNTAMILKLTLRDLRAYRKSFLTFSVLMLIIGMFIIFVNSNAVGMFTGSTSSVAMVVIAAYMAELKTKGAWIHTASLPVTRKAMVTARFFTSLVVVTINLLVWSVAFYFLAGAIKPEWQPLIGVGAIAYSWVYLLFQLALFFFVFYRFNMIVVIGLYILPTILWAVLTPKPAAMGTYVVADTQLFIGWTLICVVLFVAAYWSAISHFKKKDL